MLIDIDCYTNVDVAYKEFPFVFLWKCIVSVLIHVMWVSVKLCILQNFQITEIFPNVTITDSSAYRYRVLSALVERAAWSTGAMLDLQ
jgi:hypothetical protein